MCFSLVTYYVAILHAEGSQSHENGLLCLCLPNRLEINGFQKWNQESNGKIQMHSLQCQTWNKTEMNWWKHVCEKVWGKGVGNGEKESNRK